MPPTPLPSLLASGLVLRNFPKNIGQPDLNMSFFALCWIEPAMWNQQSEQYCDFALWLHGINTIRTGMICEPMIVRKDRTQPPKW